MTERRLQARTRLVVNVFGGESYGHDYGSYGHEEGDTLWWYEDSTLYTGHPLTVHALILDDPDDPDEDHTITAEDFIRGRYSPANETISLIPALMDDCMTMDYDIPREVFRELEARFPEAVEIEIF